MVVVMSLRLDVCVYAVELLFVEMSLSLAVISYDGVW